MRLLQTHTLQLEEFGSNQVPPYVILSHTWGAGEVTLQDMKTNKSIQLAGYEKVKNACSVAAANNFDYVWIDTCCIDKTSSAELSETLNSMYRWYEEAEECYAYLADVPHPTVDIPTEVAGDKFRKSKWFTRGWTLQELIAPSTVIFLDSEWQEIGTKASLQQVISKVTGIPGGFLLGDDLEHASIAQRMSWAAKRETTRTEDIAYCLMGIFDIYMPMMYGEGGRAFFRLQEEIIKVSDDHSLFAWRSSENHGGILASSPSAFSDSGNIITKNSSNTMSSPLTVSNRRIRLSLRFRPNDEQDAGLAILNCTEEGKESMRLAIHLRDVSLTKQDFVRDQSSTLKLLNLGDVNLSEYPLTDLYVRQWRPSRNKQLGDIDKCAIKLDGVGGEEVASRMIHLDSNWELRDGLIVTTAGRSLNGILGRFVFVCGDGSSFQFILKKQGRLLSADIDSNFEADFKQGQITTTYEQQQHERDRILYVGGGNYIHIVTETRILMFNKKKYLVGVVEIRYSNNLLGMWLSKIVILKRDIKEESLLLYAFGRGHMAVAKLLLDTRKIDISLEYKDGLAALLWAAKNGHEVMVTLLLESGANKEARDTEFDRTPLLWAAKKGHEAVIKVLLKSRAKREARDIQGRTPLLWAAREGHEAVIKVLLKSHAKKEARDIQGRTPLLWAAREGHEIAVALLLEKNAKKETEDIHGGTPLSWAALCGHEAIVKMLIDNPKVNFGWYSKTALSGAAKNGHGAVVKLLIDNTKVDVNSTDGFDGTPLSYAAENGHEAVVELLLNNTKVDPNLKDGGFGRTPLSWAAGNGHEAIVKLLLGTDQVNVNSRDWDGRTPLWFAIRSQQLVVVKLLLNIANVSTSIKDNDGVSLLSLAEDSGHEGIIALISKHTTSM